MLSFQAESVAMFVDFSALSLDRSIEEVPAVELQSWLRAENLQHTPVGRLVDLGY
jgi:hypothetical protein